MGQSQLKDDCLAEDANDLQVLMCRGRDEYRYIPPGNMLAPVFWGVLFFNNQQLVIKSELLGKLHSIKRDQKQELYKYLPILYRVL